MEHIFKGRPVLPGRITGPIVVSHSGFNTLASYMKSIVTSSRKAVCSDQNNPDLYQKELKNKIICLPQTIGSTTAGMIFSKVVQMGNAPMGLLFSDTIDSLGAAGIVLADIWIKKRVVTIDKLGRNFLSTVQDGMIAEIEMDGTVRVGKIRNEE